MNVKVYFWLRVLVFLLGIAVPGLVLKNYMDRVRLLDSERRTRQIHEPERIELGNRVVSKYLKAMVPGKTPLIGRRETSGAFEHIADFAADEAIFKRLALPGEAPGDRCLELLHSSGTFPSGLPHRVAGALVFLENRASPSREDAARLHSVLAELWRGQGFDDERLAYILGRLPEPLKRDFYLHLHYLEVTRNEKARLIKVTKEGFTGLYRPDLGELAAIHRHLAGLGLDLKLQGSEHWTALGETRGMFSWRLSVDAAQEKRNAALVALLVFLVLESALVLLFLSLSRDARSAALQGRLLTVATHELRTPLAIIRQFGELLAMGKGLTEKQKTYVKHIQRSSFAMQDLVENLLETARFEKFGAVLNRQTIPLGLWLDQVVDRVNLVGDKEVRLLCCPETDVSWDSEQMERVMVNLIGNALTHADTDVDIEVRIKEGRLRIEVRDFGKTTTALPVIGKFKRGDHRRAGLGLGLFLCDRAVRAHGGRLFFELAGPGLRAVVDLPPRVLTPDVPMEDVA